MPYTVLRPLPPPSPPSPPFRNGARNKMCDCVCVCASVSPGFFRMSQRAGGRLGPDNFSNGPSDMVVVFPSGDDDGGAAAAAGRRISTASVYYTQHEMHNMEFHITILNLFIEFSLKTDISVLGVLHTKC